MSGAIPGNGFVAEPGFSVVTPGSGVIRIIPVSVCHHVSTTGVRPPPMCSRYQTQAPGLVSSAAEPRSRSDDRSCFDGNGGPHFLNGRIAGGAGYRIVARDDATIGHHPSLSGTSGAPSYRIDVVPFASG